MARWKLATPHYLHCVDATEWEYQETDRGSGRQIRKKFTVPRYVDPKDPMDWTNRWGPQGNTEGEVIVCLPNKGERHDLAFLGDPTPDMIPVDDEARAISAGFEDRWKFKPDTDMPGNYSQSIVDRFEEAMASAQANQAPVRIEGMDQFMVTMASILQQTSELIKALTAKRKAEPELPLEQAVDDLEPLTDFTPEENSRASRRGL